MEERRTVGEEHGTYQQFRRDHPSDKSNRIAERALFRACQFAAERRGVVVDVLLSVAFDSDVLHSHFCYFGLWDSTTTHSSRTHVFAVSDNFPPTSARIFSVSAVSHIFYSPRFTSHFQQYRLLKTRALIGSCNVALIGYFAYLAVCKHTVNKHKPAINSGNLRAQKKIIYAPID